MKASILAIGTELTSGQIINKNASTVSAKLKKIGIETVCHLTVPDHFETILSSLNYIDNQVDFLFVTGGLGPTSDDFTRDVLAHWAQLKMQFNETTWNMVVERLSSRGFKVREMQKQQCFFPENSEILYNSEGTAHGFMFNKNTTTVFVLPGPPREIEAIWSEHISKILENKTIGLKKFITKSWDTLGIGESEVAFHVEEVLKNRPVDKQLEIGYRVHLPYVEVKLSFNENDESFWQPWIKKVDETLAKITVTKDSSEIAEVFLTKLTDTHFTFYDYVSNGYLHGRISPHLNKIKKWNFQQSDSPLPSDFFEEETNFLALLPYEGDKSLLIAELNGQRKNMVFEAPMKSALMAERRKQYFAEMCLIELSRL